MGLNNLDICASYLRTGSVKSFFSSIVFIHANLAEIQISVLLAMVNGLYIQKASLISQL